MIRNEIKTILQRLFPDENIIVEYAPKEKAGDYMTNLAFKIAAQRKTEPYDEAQEIAAQIRDPIIEQVIVHKPGFINFSIKPHSIYQHVFKEPQSVNIGEGSNILIEYVSANPTGPINIVSARAAAVGDSLVRLLNATGYHASSEYFINDGGRQTTLLAESLNQRMNELKGKKARIPKDGYHGAYLIDVARQAIEDNITGIEPLGEYAVNFFINNHKSTLKAFGITFDTWVRESSLYEKGYVNEVLQQLEQKALLYKKNGAVWLNTTKFGDKDDRVLITSDTRHTYLLPDIAYHRDKISRGFDRLINIWGPDHQAQIKSLQCGIQAIGQRGDALKVIIVQQVNLKKDGEIIKMSKRAGILETLDDLLKQIPKDVVRFFLLMRTNSQHLDFDLDLASRQSDENPVYYVQYAHARIKSILRKAAEEGIQPTDAFDTSFLDTSEDIALAKMLCRFPELLEDAARHLEPYMLTYYLIDLARMFHYFYQKQRVIGDNQDLTNARLALIGKTAETIKQGCDILGVLCPESM